MQRIENETTTIESAESEILRELARLHERINELENTVLSQQPK